MTRIFGHIVADAATRFVEKIGTSVTEFRVGVTRTKRTGEQYSEFYRVSIWDQRGAKMKPYLYQGRPILVEGWLKANPYIGQDGTAKASLEFSNPQITFVTANEPKTAKADAEIAAEAAAPAPEAPEMAEEDENDRPF